MATKLPALATLNATDLAFAGEPQWLQQMRQSAWHAYTEMSMPMWRRTDLSAFAPDDMHVVTGAQAGQVSGAVPAGVVVMPLSHAVQAHGDVVHKYLGSAVPAHTTKYAALNTATWQDGWFVYVPKNIVADVPLHLIQGFGTHDTLVSRTLVVLERGAQLSLIEQYTGSGAIASVVSEYIVGDGATLNVVSMQTWDVGVRHMGHQIANVGLMRE